MSTEHELEGLIQQAILQMLYEQYPVPVRAGEIFKKLQEAPHLQITENRLQRALGYMQDREQIAITKHKWFNLVELLPPGVDAAEHDANFDPKVRRRTQLLRLRILSALDSLRPHYLNEQMMRSYLRHDADLDLTHPNIPRALVYLERCRLIETSQERSLARILANGVDYLAGKGADLPGVARPVQF